MTTPLLRTDAEWRAIIAKSRIRPTKSMGQNFLVSTQVVADIVQRAAIGTDDLVIEIGPGMGILTRQLLATGARVIGVELDRDIARLLERELGGHPAFTLVEQDARYLDPEALVGDAPYKVVANLPYSAATVILRNLMESSRPPTSMTVMVQLEVAQRMTAEPGDMSLLGIATDLYADASIAFVVPPDVFLPPPKVQSAVVALTPRTTLRGTPTSRDRMFALATMAFQRKRKTLGNGLAMGLDLPKPDVERALSEAGIDPARRPQTLDVDEWIRVAEALP